MTQDIGSVIECFQRNFEKINSNENNYSSNDVLEVLRADLSEINFTVEVGKKDENKIKVPVLFGLNNRID